MAKEAPSSLFVNDGSFMERFKQLQQQAEDKGKEDKEKASSLEESKPPKVIMGASLVKNHVSVNKSASGFKANQSSSGGKLAFSLKQKSKLAAAPVKLAADEDDDEEDGKDAGKGSDDIPAKRQRLSQSDAYEPPSMTVYGVPPSPSDPTVKNVADKLASFVAKHGRQFEQVTRQKNPGDTPFRFLFDESCADFKYYEYRLAEEEKALSPNKEVQNPISGGTSTSASKSSSGLQRPVHKQSSFQTPASALYDSAEDSTTSVKRNGSDPIAMMEFYMKKAAQEEKRKQPKQSKDEMPPPASLQVAAAAAAGPGKRGHHMGDYIPQEELEKFLATCNDAAAQKNVREYIEKTKIQADNVGHKLLSKMGWKEGKGLGSSSNGIADPIMAGEVKKNNLGVGAHQPGEVTPEDDIYEQYKKRMMLGYKYRPNPLNNPRKAYY